MVKLLEIKGLCVKVDGFSILKGLDLAVEQGQVHAIMGPNGSGKSTLAKVLAGHPAYEVVSGAIWFKGQNLLEMEPERRAHLGLFMGFQYPVEIAGVSNRLFLRSCSNSVRKARGLAEWSEEEFESILRAKMEAMEINDVLKERSINEGFSGGEKKRNEILQMALLEPDLAVLDETDSGLDIDAIRIVAGGVNRMKRQDNALILITHYQRLLDYVKPDFVHVLSQGVIVRTAGPELALELEATGYQ